MSTSQGTYKGVNITPGSDADIAKQMAAIDAGASGSTSTAQLGTQAYSQQLLQQAQQLLNSSKVPAAQPSPITPTSNTQTTPYNAPPPPPPTNQGAVDLKALQEGMYAATGFDQKENDALAQKETSTLDEIKAILDHQGTIDARTAQIEAEKGIPDLNKAINEITAQMRAFNADALQQIENQGGRLAPMFGIVGEQERIQRLNNAKQYSLAAQGQFLQGNLALARDNVDRAIKAEFGGDEARLKYLELTLNLNKEKLAASDQKKFRALELALQEKKDILAAEMQDKETMYGLALQARQGGAPNDIVDAIMNSGDIGAALQAAGDYLIPQTVASIQEYNFAKKNGYKGSYTQYQNEDANRKIAIARAGASGLTPYQESQALTRLNDSISKNTTYTKTVAMRTFVQGVTTALDMQNGVSDIAAINQFQKVIDEGAVTRDQDVKLIQSAQSLASSLQTKISRLQKGDQLSPQQRQQMKELVTKIYEAQVKSLQNDPYVKAKTTEAIKNGFQIEDTILGELGGFSPTQSTPTGAVTGTLPNGTKVTKTPDGAIRDAQGNLYDQNGNKISSYLSTKSTAPVKF